MKKSVIPAIKFDSKDADVLGAMKDTIETITGQSGGKILKLGDKATLLDVIIKVNQILDRLQ